MFKITGKNIDVGENLSKFIEDEFHNLVNKYVGAVSSSHVVISKENHHFVTEFSVNLHKNFIIHCVGNDEDPYHSVKLALNKLASKVRKYKKRLQDRRKHNEDALAFSAMQYIVDHHEDEVADVPVVISETTKEIDCLTVNEAVMRLDLMDKVFLMFKNAGNNHLNLVYRRPDGNIGWIDANPNNEKSN